MKKIIAIAMTAVLLAACDQKGSVESTKDRAKAEREAGRDVDNGNLAQKARQMEQDLRRRYRFFKGIAHDYKGMFKIGENAYYMKASFSPTLHVIDVDRVRNLEEIQDDINNLMLNAQVTVWDYENRIGANGCIFEGIRPDLRNGVVQLVSEQCPNRFTVKLTVPGTSADLRDTVSANLAKALLDGVQGDVELLFVEANSKFNPVGYSAQVERQK